MLDIREIEKIDHEKKEKKKELYTKIYEQWERKIRAAVSLGHQKFLFLQVPRMVLGFPSFDRAKAAKWLARQFEKGGFVVQLVGTDGQEVYVSWDVKKKKTTKKPEPAAVPNFDDMEFPTLINLKKAADKYRKK
jgi:hypothetical protein